MGKKKSVVLRATEVFTPGSFPAKTYVERDGSRLEQALRDAIEATGQVVSLVGPSKSGKTVLVERVVGQDQLIPITGAGIHSVDEIWNRILDWIEVPTTTSRSSGTSTSTTGSGTVSGGASIPFVAKASADVSVGIGRERQDQEVRDYGRRGLPHVVKEIGGSEFVVLLDDFHYMPREVQAEAAKSLKEAVRLGVRICTASVMHRGDDLVRANPELRGRVRSIDLDYWSVDDLRMIAETGFSILNVDVGDQIIPRMLEESAGSPQLLQLICLQTCFSLGIRTTQERMTRHDVDSDRFESVLEQASASTDFRSLVDVLDSGPKTRGTERKLYQFIDGSRGDVYRCVLKAIAANPPRLSYRYDELLGRTESVCNGDAPVGSSVTGTCHHMSKLAAERFPSERAIDWDEQKQILDIPDPYFLFYLRWSNRLTEPE